VSNIRSKIELQEKIMEAHGHFQGDSILRISEFWKILLARHHPEKKIIPDDLLEFLAEDWIQKNPAFQIKTSSRNLLIQACHQLSDLIFSDQQDYLLQWAEENPSVHLHWIHWVEICRTFMMDIIQRKNCLSSRWIPGFLLQSFSNFNDLQFWDKKIILDLGSDLHSSEAQLFSRQGQIFAIDVLKPIPPEKKFSPQLKTYDFLELVEDGKPLPPSNQKIEILRHETALGEIQFAVAQIRKWIEQDHIPPKDIVVLFANYDSYWQKFSHLCQLEGIPLDQSIKTKIIELPLVQNWLSQCWTSCGIFDKGQTFHFLFSPEAQKIPFQSYLRKYSLYEETDDLLAIPELSFYQNGAKEITGSINIFHSLMNIFIFNAKKFSNPEDQKILQKCIQFIWQNLSDFPEQVVGNYRKIIQKILTHSEISLSPSIQKSTIHTSQLQSCQIHQGVKRIYLGINQENFYVTPKIYSSEETNLMTKELNLFFEDDESGLSEFELYWQSHSHFEQTLYNYCGSDFQGELLSPHHFITEMKYFHKKNEQQPVMELSPTIYSTMGYNELSTEKSESLRKGVEQDQGLTKMAIEMSHNRIHLSATHLQNYRKCPFIYYSEKMLKLKDLPQVDFDIDPMSEGILIHSVFENLLLKKDETWEDDLLEQ
ncbi:MAG: PD-(D/E)XK nuclease family protein, partial [Pseudobdellovibrionaceae bacterium]